jgi:hypothetical protein
VITDLSENALQVHMNPDSIDLLVQRQKAYLKPIGKGLLLVITSFFLLSLDDTQKTLSITLFSLGIFVIFLNL